MTSRKSASCSCNQGSRVSGKQGASSRRSARAATVRGYRCGVKHDRNGKLTDRGGKRARWVQHYRQSRLGLREFAQRHGLRPEQLHYWVYQSPQAPEPRAPVPKFQEVRLGLPALRAGSWSTEIGLPNDITVRLARGTDVAWAMALIEGLHRPCSPR